MRKFPLPRHRKAIGYARGAPQVDMRLDEASHWWTKTFALITTLIQFLDYNFWPAQKQW
jgi:hypothetical protein